MLEVKRTFFDNIKKIYKHSNEEKSFLLYSDDINDLEEGYSPFISTNNNLFCVDIDVKGEEHHGFSKTQSNYDILDELFHIDEVFGKHYIEDTRNFGLHILFYVPDELDTYAKSIKSAFVQLGTFACTIECFYKTNRIIYSTGSTKFANIKPITPWDTVIKYCEQRELEYIKDILDKYRKVVVHESKVNNFCVSSGDITKEKCKEILDFYVNFIKAEGVHKLIQILQYSSYCEFWVNIGLAIKNTCEDWYDIYEDFSSKIPVNSNGSGEYKESYTRKTWERWNNKSYNGKVVTFNKILNDFVYHFCTDDIINSLNTFNEELKKNEIVEVEIIPYDPNEFIDNFLLISGDKFKMLVDYYFNNLHGTLKTKELALELSIFTLTSLIQNKVMVEIDATFIVSFHQFLCLIGNAFAGKSEVMKMILGVLNKFNYDNKETKYAKNIVSFDESMSSYQKFRNYLYKPTNRNNIVVYDEAYKFDCIKYLYNNNDKNIAENTKQLGLFYQKSFGSFSTNLTKGGSLLNGEMFSVDGISTSLLLFNTYKEIMNINADGGGLSRIRHKIISQIEETKVEKSLDFLDNLDCIDDLKKDFYPLSDELLRYLEEFITKYTGINIIELEKNVSLTKIVDVNGKKVTQNKSQQELNKEYSQISIAKDISRYAITYEARNNIYKSYVASLQTNNESLYARRMLYANKLYCLSYIISGNTIVWEKDYYKKCVLYVQNDIEKFEKLVKINELGGVNDIEKINIDMYKDIEETYKKLNNEFYFSDFTMKKRSLRKYKGAELRANILMYLEGKAELTSKKKYRKI